ECARIAARPPISLTCRSMMVRAEGSDASRAGTSRDVGSVFGAAGFGAGGFGAEGACAVCAITATALPNATTSTIPVNRSATARPREAVRVGLQKLERSTQIHT